jgi:AcrR family transcriptional regulator
MSNNRYDSKTSCWLWPAAGLREPKEVVVSIDLTAGGQRGRAAGRVRNGGTLDRVRGDDERGDESRSVMPAHRPEGTRRNSRAALIEAAFEEFSTKGYEAATVAGIAERAGVTTGALYAHFAGKLDLLLATVGLVPVEDILRSAREIAALPRSEATKAIVQSMSARPDRRMLLLLDVIVVARRDPHIAQILRRGLESYLRATVRANDEAVVLGVIDPPLASDDLARVQTLLTLGKVVFGALDEAPPSDLAFARLADLLLQSARADDGDGDGDRDGDRPAALARVRARAVAVERARRALHDGIVDAVDEGHSLRQVGTAAGLSHERIRQVLRETRDRVTT